MTTGLRTALSLAVAAFGVAGVVVLAGTAVRTGPSAPDATRAPLHWEPGACVNGSDAGYVLTPCNGGQYEVLAIAADPPGHGGCPDDTDDVVRIGDGRTACVRSYLDPHLGAPGVGGGMLRAGDCVTLDGRERPCAQRGWYGRALAIETRAAACPSGTLDTVGTGPVACLGPGGQVLDRGMCVARPDGDTVDRAAITRVGCGSRGAWARVTSFETRPRSCPKGSQRYLRARGAYRPVTCLRLVSK
ncbi:hypothetical protein [Nonomuraea roseoviolacea]|uniref:Secreted protein n=1 Tax=Nonomuraea roseoviolacea subsp. carminata TaxID=160689 RepID=A0ABT1K3K1_9ACTN|nr:hypothetical protein [Nonomuraea roseoviolacea]MCP2348445.1 hypothetical protein [Nonomuraea roseoviolacea subsp. carminata]